MLTTSENLAIDAGSYLVCDVAPWIEGVADKGVSVGIRKIYGASKGIMMIILSISGSAQAEQAIRVAVMGKEASISGVALFQHGMFVIVVIDVATFAVFMADAEAGGVVVVLAESDSSAGRASGDLDQLVDGIVYEGDFLVCQRAVDLVDRVSVFIIKV